MSTLRLSLLGACLCLVPCGAMAQGAAKLTDPQIAHIAYTAGQIDIQAAELALKQSKNKEVRAFANDMVRDHKAVNEKALALVKKLNVKPEDNDTSRSLMQQAGAKKKELMALKGAAFDKACASSVVPWVVSLSSLKTSTAESVSRRERSATRVPVTTTSEMMSPSWASAVSDTSGVAASPANASTESRELEPVVTICLH